MERANICKIMTVILFRKPGELSYYMCTPRLDSICYKRISSSDNLSLPTSLVQHLCDGTKTFRVGGGS